MALNSLEIPQNQAGDNSGDSSSSGIGSSGKNGSGNGSLPFEGYGNPNFVMLPRIFIRHQMQDLTEAELKVMLYIFDHTWGYTDGEGNRKDADAISRSQFLNGIRRLDGTQLDRGAGVSDRSLDRALDSLVKRGYIFRHHRTAANGRSDTNIYELNRFGKPSIKSTQNPQSQERADKSRAEGAVQKPVNTDPLGQDRAVRLAAQKQETNNDRYPRNFTPLAETRIEATPANLRPSLPANLRPSTPANLPETIENSNKQKIKQHTTTRPGMAVSLGPEGKTASDTRFLSDTSRAATNPNSELKTGTEEDVCVSFSTYEFEEHLLNSQPSTSSANSALGASKQQNRQPAKRTGSKPAAAIEKSQEPEQLTLMQDLIQAGVSQKEAAALAALARQNGHPDSYVKSTLDYIDRQRSVHNREGLLIHLIKTNWQPPADQEQTGAMEGQTAAIAVAVPLPPAGSVKPEHLPRLIEIEERNLREAASEFERETARTRLQHFRSIAAQLSQSQTGSIRNSEKKG
ncbi:MAG: hypothetical protein J0I20_22555 [Chloroflexi bacterium]|nr:hypothetical protein [Chloroflexota bacterium]OJV99158.1 MAG: hypothetical protein BGO39_17025 [Chloroflexi bacterium 54-19]